MTRRAKYPKCFSGLVARRHAFFFPLLKNTMILKAMIVNMHTLYGVGLIHGLELKGFWEILVSLEFF